MKIVTFTLPTPLSGSTLELPDDVNLFSSIHLDSQTGTLQAVYTGEQDLPQLTADMVPRWDEDTQAWREFNARRKQLTRKEFHLSFTPAEYRQIVNTAQANDELFQLWNALNVADYVDLEDPETVQGMQYLVSLELLTQERYAEIMQGLPENP